MIGELLKIYWFGFTAATSSMCLLITILVLLDKKRELKIYEGHDSILIFELLLLLIGIFSVFWFGVDIMGG